MITLKLCVKRTSVILQMCQSLRPNARKAEQGQLILKWGFLCQGL